MDAPVFRSSPEDIIQRAIIAFLELRGWFVRETHGNAYQKGFPDLYMFHREYGSRWVDCKNPVRHRYTKAQCQEWPKWEAAGVGIWIMFEASEEAYATLFADPNFRKYWKPHYDKYNTPIASIISEILE